MTKGLVRESVSIAFTVWLLASSLPIAQCQPAPDNFDIEGRLRMALQIARESNDRKLVAAVESTGRAFSQGLPEDADTRLRQLEKQVGIDPGGWSMAGQALFHPTPEMLKQYQALQPKLAAAMDSDDATQVQQVTADMLSVLKEQAGVPDGRRAGSKPEPRVISEAAATKLFLDALSSEGGTIRQLAQGQLLPDQMARVYAYLLNAVVTIRPLVEQHQPQSLEELDKLTAGVAGILIKLQQPEGFFPFPDLRGKNIRFGQMIDKQVSGGKVVVSDGWVVSVDPDGGSQFDTGVCGAALLLAGEMHDNEQWKLAGLRAADWSLTQACCSNFNYNAFSVSLLAQAFRLTGQAKYLDGALRKFQVGVAPGQAPNGRWIDAHNARTVYHVIILRALGDLAAVLTDESFKAERAELDQMAKRAVQALLDEFAAMGITVEALPELMTLAELYPRDAQLHKAVHEMAEVIFAKCTDGRRVKMGSQPHQLAAVALACSLFKESR